jgi:hypothetical protein
MYDCAYDYIQKNRPTSELKLFERLYGDKLPYYLTMVLYNSKSPGIRKHKDHAPFCTVIFCFQGNKACFYLTSEYGEDIQSLCFARVDHWVDWADSNGIKRIVCIAVF